MLLVPSDSMEQGVGGGGGGGGGGWGLEFSLILWCWKETLNKINSSFSRTKSENRSSIQLYLCKKLLEKYG